MLMDDDGLPGQRVSPTRLLQLKSTISQRNGIVLVDAALMLQAKDPVQILASRTNLDCGGKVIMSLLAK